VEVCFWVPLVKNSCKLPFIMCTNVVGKIIFIMNDNSVLFKERIVSFSHIEDSFLAGLHSVAIFNLFLFLLLSTFPLLKPVNLLNLFFFGCV